MLTIDGSEGEGGGQVLRTSLALSLVTGTPFRIENIRARRSKPGLMRQHLTAVEAAAQISRAELTGASVGSQQLTFSPGPVIPGKYAFAVGTAGSATLVLQTILPALMCAPGPTVAVFEGGTHNPLAPPFDFLQRAFLPLIARMGPKVTATLERPGFYPAGGGRFTVEIEPVGKLAPLELMERGEIRSRRARALIASLPPHIATRELEVVAAKLGWEQSALQLETIEGSRGPGNVLLIEVESDHVTELVTSFGEKGVRAEQVATQAVEQVRRYLAAGVPVGEHLADQLLLPLAMAGGGGFRTLSLSRHATTQIETLRRFLGVAVQTEELGRDDVRVRIG